MIIGGHETRPASVVAAEQAELLHRLLAGESLDVFGGVDLDLPRLAGHALGKLEQLQAIAIPCARVRRELLAPAVTLLTALSGGRSCG